MTEYDYSEEGYKKYLSTQNRVSNWVNAQAHCAHQYQSPFGTRAGSTPPNAYSSSRRSHDHHSSRTSPPPSRPSHKRSLTNPEHPSGYKSSRSSHSTYQQPLYSQTHIPYSPPLPRGMDATYKTYTYDASTKEIVLPPPRPGEQYVIIPPKGRRVEVVGDANVSPSSLSRSSARSPTKKNPPLLKRLLTTFVSEPKTSGRQGGRTRSY